MEVLVQACTVLTTILGLLAAALGLMDGRRVGALWVACAAICCAVLGFFGWLQLRASKYDSGGIRIVPSTTVIPVSESSAAEPEPRLSELTPGFIADALKNAPDSEREAVARTYVGASVVWRLGLLRLITSEQQDVQMSFDTGKSAFSVFVEIPLKGNDFIRTAKRGQMFIVSGTIRTIKAGGVSLSDCSVKRTK